MTSLAVGALRMMPATAPRRQGTRHRPASHLESDTSNHCAAHDRQRCRSITPGHCDRSGDPAYRERLIAPFVRGRRALPLADVEVGAGEDCAVIARILFD
jgi:hypothetical protein